MFDKFRQQYPQGSIISNLVQIHGDRYIVSVSVANDRVVLVTTLAADVNIEIAEDRAMMQAMKVMGFSQPLPVATPSITPELPSQPELPRQIETVETGETIAPPVQPAIEPEPALEQVLAKQPAQVRENPAANTYQPEADEPALSVTDMIPLINMELKRLNWSREKGRDCIIALYNKRSSSLLSDEELWGLLRYLQAQTIPD